MAQQQPHEIVWTLVNVCVAARCIHVIAELGVADHIEDQPVSVGELASSCEVNADALDRVLRLLTAHGVFDREEGRYRHTPASRLLQSDHPMTMRPFARMMGLPFGWGSLTQLAHSIRTGLPAIEIREPKGFWVYLQNHPDEGWRRSRRGSCCLRFHPLRKNRRRRGRPRASVAIRTRCGAYR